VDGASAIQVRFKDGSVAKATLVGTDPSSDIAVIKVNVASSKLKPLALADSGDVNPGRARSRSGAPSATRTASPRAS
jgi:S1-C subfamily serine protease